MGRHAYLILAHKNVRQLVRLIELLDDPRNDIFLHIDAKNKSINKEELLNAAAFSKVAIVEPGYEVNWGGVSIMRAELALLEKATQSGEYDYYHLLSGMDLPIKTQDEIHAFFEENKGKEFVKLWPFKKSTFSRFRYYTVFPEGESKFATRIVNHIFKGMQMLVGFRINRNIDFKFGSQWFSITDSLARYVVGRRDWLEKVFRRTSTCDEIFLPTLVWNSPYRDNLYEPTPAGDQKEPTLADMRFIDWTRGDSIRHPWVFLKSDFELLMSVPHLWARKFDEEVDSEIIDKIYATLKG